MQLPVNAQAVTTALSTWFAPGEVFEIRVLNALTKRWNSREHTEFGYFDYEHINEIPGLLDQLLSYKGVYVTVNPLNPAVLGRAKNHFSSGQAISAKDTEVMMRRWLLVDCDAIRVSGVSSSDTEHQYALDKASEIASKLASIGWPEPIRLDSGNGAQLMYRVDLPVNDDGLVKRCLEQLKLASNEHVEIDQTVFNPARIWRLPGMWNCKGDECPEQSRVHRQSQILSIPSSITSVPLPDLLAFAPKPPEAITPSDPGRFDIHDFIARHFPSAKAVPYAGGSKWVLDVCPFNPDHNDRSAVITQSKDGKLGFVCHHNGCAGKNWHDLRALLESLHGTDAPSVGVDLSGLLERVETHGNAQLDPPATDAPEQAETPAEKRARVTPFLSELYARYPARSPIVIDGLLREREVMNLIAAPKTGKTWFVMQLALSVALGREWLGRQVAPKRVLVIDNELAPEEFTYRYRIVAEALGINLNDLDGRLFTYPQRGDLKSISVLEDIMDIIQENDIGLIIVDAFYRAMPRGTEENSNEDITAVYNLVDHYAQRGNASFILIHHTSKGAQAAKSVTDVGSGAGAQSRAADAHLVLLKHLEPSVVVVKGVARSFAKVEPTSIRQIFPLWAVAPDCDPRLLEGISPAELKRIKEENTPPMPGPSAQQYATPEPEPITNESVAHILSELGGTCLKTKFIATVRQKLNITRSSATSLIQDAVDCGCISMQTRVPEDGGPKSYVYVTK